VVTPEATLARPVARSLLSRRRRELLAGYAYLIPAILCLGGTVLFPILKAAHMSLYHNVLIKPKEYAFIGLGNYVRLLKDEVFWLSLWNSFVWVFGSVSLQFLGGFVAALLLHQTFRGRALVRTLTLLPWIIPGIVVALVWEWLYQPNYGVINDILFRLGWLHDRVAWLSDPRLAMPAGITRVIWTFNYADLIFVMTGGGPAHATQITSTYTLQQAYSNLDFGYAATLSIVLLLIMHVFTIVYLRVTKGVESVS
jgi:multiple sugar transport system permease protein